MGREDGLGRTSENAVMAKFSIAQLTQTAQETSSNPPRTPGGPSSSNETRTYFFCSLIP
jgi:hypothetical protein